MRRPDLSEDGAFDGWQVVDPTPQEKSDGTDVTLYKLQFMLITFLVIK